MKGYKGSEVENAVYILKHFWISTLPSVAPLYSNCK